MEEFLKAIKNFQPAPPQPVEFRIYYDPVSGDILDYTTEQRAGDFIVVSKDTFHRHRFEYKVKNGKLIPPTVSIGKLRPSTIGTPCHPGDVSLVIADDQSPVYWKIHTYEQD